MFFKCLTETHPANEAYGHETFMKHETFMARLPEEQATPLTSLFISHNINFILQVDHGAGLFASQKRQSPGEAARRLQVRFSKEIPTRDCNGSSAQLIRLSASDRLNRHANRLT